MPANSQSLGRNQDQGSGGPAGHPGHPAPARGRVSSFVLWFGLFGAPAAWSVQLLVNYPMAAHTCFPRLIPLASPTIGHGGLTTATTIVSIVAILVAIAAGVAAIAAWRQTSGESGGQAHWLLDTGEGRTRFMAASGLMTSGLFLLAIIVHTISIFTVAQC